jgi:transposase-like protein
MPSFVISDREKGLINAVEEVFGTDLHHAYCFHHIMENFNKKFKNKDLKGFVWDIAKATTDSDFEEKLKILTSSVCQGTRYRTVHATATNSYFR